MEWLAVRGRGKRIYPSDSEAAVGAEVEADTGCRR